MDAMWSVVPARALHVPSRSSLQQLAGGAGSGRSAAPRTARLVVEAKKKKPRKSKLGNALNTATPADALGVQGIMESEAVDADYKEFASAMGVGKKKTNRMMAQRKQVRESNKASPGDSNVYDSIDDDDAEEDGYAELRAAVKGQQKARNTPAPREQAPAEKAAQPDLASMLQGWGKKGPSKAKAPSPPPPLPEPAARRTASRKERREEERRAQVEQSPVSSSGSKWEAKPGMSIEMQILSGQLRSSPEPEAPAAPEAPPSRGRAMTPEAAILFGGQHPTEKEGSFDERLEKGLEEIRKMRKSGQLSKQAKERAIAKGKAEKERAEKEAKARAKAEAQAKVQAEAEARAKAKAEKQRAEAEAKARAEAEARAKAQAEADAKAKAEAEARAKELAVARARAEAEAKELAEARARAEAHAKELAEARAKAEAEVKALAEARAKVEAEAKAQAEAVAKIEAEAKALEEAKAKAKAETEAKELAEARAKADAEAKALEEARATAQAEAKAEAEARGKVEAEAKALEAAKEEAARQELVGKLAQLSAKRSTVEGRVVHCNKGGLLVALEGLEVVGFLPFSRMGRTLKGGLLVAPGSVDHDHLLGTTVDCRVRSYDSTNPRFDPTVSLDNCRAGCVVESADYSDWPFQKKGGLAEGAEEDFLCLSSSNYAVFGKVRGVVPAMVHVRELDWDYVKDCKDRFKPGEAFRAKVIGVDEAKGQVSLSRKALLEVPAEVAAAQQASKDKEAAVQQRLRELQKGDPVEFTVDNIANFGVFGYVPPGVPAMIHISELSNTYFKDCADIVTVGQVVQASVLQVDMKEERLALSLKALQPDPTKENLQTLVEAILSESLEAAEAKLEEAESLVLQLRGQENITGVELGQHYRTTTVVPAFQVWLGEGNQEGCMLVARKDRTIHLIKVKYEENKSMDLEAMRGILQRCLV